MEKNTEIKAYDGNCHCGLFKFRLHIPTLTTVWTCNCSICSRNGYLWIFPVPEKSLTIEAGNEKALHAYEFAMRGTRHLFCPECGSSVLARRREAPPDQSLRINARMLEGVHLTALEVKKFSGADIDVPAASPSQDAAKEGELKQYSGNCHCGAIKYNVKIPELTEVAKCNCSHCTKKGNLAKWPVAEENLVLEKGEELLKTYKFESKKVEHKFCPTCGSYIFGKSGDMPPAQRISINVRMFKDVDVDSLGKIDFDGATILGSKYVAPSIPDYEGEVEKGMKVYKGNCHCGAVTYALKSTPIDEMEIMSCNCSLCSRNGDLFIYPRSNTVQVHGKDNLAEYFFVSSMHSFCRKCGNSVLVRQTGEGDNETPINVRTLNGVELSTLKYQYYNGKAAGKPYEL